MSESFIEWKINLETVFYLTYAIILFWKIKDIQQLVIS